MRKKWENFPPKNEVPQKQNTNLLETCLQRPISVKTKTCRQMQKTALWHKKNAKIHADKRMKWADEPIKKTLASTNVMTVSEKRTFVAENCWSPQILSLKNGPLKNGRRSDDCWLPHSVKKGGGLGGLPPGVPSNPWKALTARYGSALCPIVPILLYEFSR